MRLTTSAVSYLTLLRSRANQSLEITLRKNSLSSNKKRLTMEWQMMEPKLTSTFVIPQNSSLTGSSMTKKLRLLKEMT